ncbi:MAG: rhodanese-like domain-containing protein [Niabella sp.]
MKGLRFRSVYLFIFGILIINTSFAQEKVLLSPEEFAKSVSPAVFLLDVRSPTEFAKSHLANAVNVNVMDSTKNFTEEVSKLSNDKTIYLYCQSGKRSARAAALLNKAGYNTVEINGGLLNWQADNKPLVDVKGSVNNELTVEEFKRLTALNDKVVVKFYHPVCKPAPKIEEYLRKAEKESDGKMTIVRLDMSKHKTVSKELQVSTYPRIQIYKKGKLQWQSTEYMKEKAMLRMIKTHL